MNDISMNNISMINTSFTDRKLWIDILLKIITPPLESLSQSKLKLDYKIKVSPSWDNRDINIGYLEMFSRIIAGISPWLSIKDDDTEEGVQRKYIKDLAVTCISNAVNPASKDCMKWSHNQSLVESAYLIQGFITCKSQLWDPLALNVKTRYIEIFRSMRNITPINNNWILFPGMVEAFFITIGESYDKFRLNMIIKTMERWYIGDGFYKDGEDFAMDYYNSFDIHSMYIYILTVLQHKQLLDKAIKRMIRYSEFLERLISQDGTFPPFGRSISYRLACFQSLSHCIFLEKISENHTYGQLRAALTAVIKKLFIDINPFDTSGYLNLGLYGEQASIADYYTNTGSLYLTTLGFVALGLPYDHTFWTCPPEEWSQLKCWNNKPFSKHTFTGV